MLHPQLILKLTTFDIDFLKDFFSKKPVKRAYLFGSYSRDNVDEESKIDILVELDYAKPIGLGFIQMKYELEDSLHKTVDLVSERSVSKHILSFLIKDKILIYEK